MCVNVRAAPGMAQRIVHYLVQPLYGTNRNVCIDSHFTTLQLCEELLEEGLTVVGTINERRTFIPPEFKKARERAVQSSVFVFREEATLVS